MKRPLHERFADLADAWLTQAETDVQGEWSESLFTCAAALAGLAAVALSRYPLREPLPGIFSDVWAAATELRLAWDANQTRQVQDAVMRLVQLMRQAQT